MNHFSEMEWNSSKWDWENLVAFGSKAIESPKKLQLADWMIVDDGEIDAGCFNPSATAGGVNSGASGSHVSSAKSSVSASTDSSTRDGMKGPDFRLMTFEGFTGNFCDKMEVKGAEVVSVEPLIGLKLGKCTYFENSSAGGTVKSAAFSVKPTPSTAATLKKNKSGGQNLPAPRCLVEGCNVDLSSAKEYHRKHRVCDGHSKSPKVIVGGLERRFCQQCSRFHGLGEFDEKKRSCRRRLSDHNARRRKPPQETIHFNSTRLSSTFYEGRQQMSYLLSSAPHGHSRNPDNTVWNNMCNSKFTITKEYSPKCNIDEGTNGHTHMPGIKLPNVIDMRDNPPDGFLASKSSIPETLSPGSKGSLLSPNLHAAPEYHRCALSLLSSNSWGSCEPESMPVHPHVHQNQNVTQAQLHTIPEGVPFSSSSDFWLTGHQLNHPPASNFKTPNEADFYSNILN